MTKYADLVERKIDGGKIEKEKYTYSSMETKGQKKNETEEIRAKHVLVLFFLVGRWVDAEDELMAVYKKPSRKM